MRCGVELVSRSDDIPSHLLDPTWTANLRRRYSHHLAEAAAGWKQAAEAWDLELTRPAHRHAQEALLACAVLVLQWLTLKDLKREMADECRRWLEDQAIPTERLLTAPAVRWSARCWSQLSQARSATSGTLGRAPVGGSLSLNAAIACGVGRSTRPCPWTKSGGGGGGGGGARKTR